MKSLRPLLLMSLLLGACSTLNDAAVRMWFQDRGLSDRVNGQIREGLERRAKEPVQTQPGRPVPAFLDQG